MAKKLKEYGASPIKIASTGFKGFKTAVDRVPVISLRDVPEAELKQQFRTFLTRLSEMTPRMSPEELAKTDTKDLIQKFVDPAGREFDGIEMIMQYSLLKSPFLFTSLILL